MVSLRSLTFASAIRAAHRIKAHPRLFRALSRKASQALLRHKVSQFNRQATGRKVYFRVVAYNSQGQPVGQPSEWGPLRLL